MSETTQGWLLFGYIVIAVAAFGFHIVLCKAVAGTLSDLDVFNCFMLGVLWPLSTALLLGAALACWLAGDEEEKDDDKKDGAT